MSPFTIPCDICHHTPATWPNHPTVLGPHNLCGNCYWRYQEVLEQIAAFFRGPGD
jgi:hypothetical protein